jgi:endonuclease IV
LAALPRLDGALGRNRARECLGTELGAAQVFLFETQKPISTVDPEEAGAVKDFVDSSGLRLLSHGSYLTAPWNKSPFTAAMVRAERRVAALSGAEGVVVHLGRPGPKEVCRLLPKLIGRRSAATGGAWTPADSGDTTPLDNPYLKAAERNAAVEELTKKGGALDLAPKFPRSDEIRGMGLELPRILLEPSGHVKPENSHYHTPEQLGELLRKIREGPDPGLSQTGLCLDTAHLWANGVDVSTAELALDWVGKFDEAFDDNVSSGRGSFDPRVLAVHLNDSYDVLGGARDHHAGLLIGNLWGGKSARRSGLPAFVDLAKRRGSVTILERNPATLIPGDLCVLQGLDPTLIVR